MMLQLPFHHQLQVKENELLYLLPSQPRGEKNGRRRGLDRVGAKIIIFTVARY